MEVGGEGGFGDGFEGKGRGEEVFKSKEGGRGLKSLSHHNEAELAWAYCENLVKIKLISKEQGGGSFILMNH